MEGKSVPDQFDTLAIRAIDPLTQSHEPALATRGGMAGATTYLYSKCKGREISNSRVIEIEGGEIRNNEC